MSEINLREKIANLQNEVMSIDAQMTERKSFLENKKNSEGFVPNEEFRTYLDWKRKANRKKQCLLTELRHHKLALRDVDMTENEMYKRIGYFVVNKMPPGALVKSEDKFFSFEGNAEDAVTDEFEKFEDLIKEMKEMFKIP